MKNVTLPGLLLGGLAVLVACGRREETVPVEAPSQISPARAAAIDMNSTHAVAAPAVNLRAVLASSTSSPSDPTPQPGVQTYTEEEDFDGDGIADARTIRHFSYDAVGRPCRIVIERDFDADGKIDSRKTKLSSYDTSGACGS